MPEWHQLLGKQTTVCGEEHKLQQLVATQTMRLVSEGEIINTGEVPRLRKSPTTITVFKELCQVVWNGSKYKQIMEARYCSVWHQVPSAERYFKRLLVAGEPAVVQSFLRACTVCDLHDKMEDMDPASDLASMVAKLVAATDALKAAQAQENRAGAEKEEDIFGETEGQGGPCSAAGPGAQDSETPAGTASSQKAEDPVSEPAKEELQQPSPEEEAYDRLLAKAKMALEEMSVIYDRCWKSGDPAPAALQKSQEGTLYVVPSPATSRGLANRAVSALRGAGVGVLEFFGPADAIVVGLGHECEQKATAISRLKQMSPELGKAQYKLLNINMTAAGTQYVEYILIGYGIRCQLQPMSLAWLGPMHLCVDREARIRKCECSTSPKIIAELADSGSSMGMCEMGRAMHSRFITPLPKNMKEARATRDDLLGGVICSEDTGHDASSVSTDQGEDEGDDSEDEQPKAEAKKKKR